MMWISFLVYCTTDEYREYKTYYYTIGLKNYNKNLYICANDKEAIVPNTIDMQCHKSISQHFEKSTEAIG